MKQELLSILRNKETDTAKFRQAANTLSYILAAEASEYLHTNKIKLQTQWADAEGAEIVQPVLSVILRAGLALLPAFMDFFKNSSVGFIGLKRDELTAIAKLYYFNVPKAHKNTQIILLDPTIATGGSAISAIASLKEFGYQEENIIFVSILTAREGLERVKLQYPAVKFVYVQIDPELNDQKFIVPGFGDFGDRYFGT